MNLWQILSGRIPYKTWCKNISSYESGSKARDAETPGFIQRMIVAPRKNWFATPIYLQYLPNLKVRDDGDLIFF